MKFKLLSFVFMLATVTGMSQNNPISGSRAYEIIVQKDTSVSNVTSTNTAIKGLQKSAADGNRSLGEALKNGYGALASTTVVSLTSDLVDYTVGIFSTAIKNRKEQFNNWYSAARSYRQFSKTLSQQQMIGDFYALPSTNGAFDPANIAFKGLGFRSYFCTEGKDGSKKNHDVYCYIFCSLRTDQEGLESLVNHSKFLLEIDSIYFRPNICDIPSNVTREISGSNDFFEKQSNLNVSLNAKIYSSWFNEAIMLQRDQLLGSFDIVMKIDPEDCKTVNGEKVFVYSKATDSGKYQPSTGEAKKGTGKTEISIAGESFIVPRSFSMDASSNSYSPVWGTGEYRVELTLAETSDINTDYYYSAEYKSKKAQQPGAGNGKGGSAAVDKDCFDKEIWQAEWTEMKAAKEKMPNGNDKSDSYLKGAWKEIKSTVKGSSWTTTFLSPLMNVVTDAESKAINEALDIENSQSASNATQGTSTNQVPTAGDGAPNTLLPVN